jgi:hypothetical protein
VSDRITRTEIEELHGRWTARFEEALAEAPSSPAELRELAERHRQLARASDTAGQRRAFADAAERYEQAARERVRSK